MHEDAFSPKTTMCSRNLGDVGNETRRFSRWGEAFSLQARSRDI